MKEFLINILWAILFVCTFLLGMVLCLPSPAAQGEPRSIPPIQLPPFLRNLPEPEVVPESKNARPLNLAPIKQDKQGTLKVNPDTYVKILGEVSTPMMQRVTSQLLYLSEQGAPEIYINIGGPGGEARAQDRILQAMSIAKTRGSKLICFVPILAASASFNMFILGCDEHYVLSSARLMFHPVRRMGVSMPIGLEEDFKRIGGELEEANNWLLTEFCKKMMPTDMPACVDVLVEPYYAERVWKAEALQKFTKPGFLTILKDIQGIGTEFLLESNR